MSIKEKINDLLLVLMTPDCWEQNEKYSKQWDKEFNDLLKNNEFKPHVIEFINHSYTSRHEVDLGGVNVWVANPLYSVFTLQYDDPKKGTMRVRPKRSTIIKAWDKYIKDISKYYEPQWKIKKIWSL